MCGLVVRTKRTDIEVECLIFICSPIIKIANRITAQPQNKMSVSCRLFRKLNESGWMELSRQISGDVPSSGIVLREISSGSLLADFPQAQIKQINVLSSFFVRIVIRDETEMTALKFGNESECESFCRMLQRHNITVSNVTEERGYKFNNFIPDVNDSHTQEFLLNLMFSDEFKTFVSNLGGLFDLMNDNLTSASARDDFF